MPYALLGLAVVMIIAWLAFGCTLYRCYKKFDKDLYWTQIQMCDLDDGYGKLRDKVDDQKKQSLKLSEQLEFASDYCLGIHHGLIEIGGHSHSSPSADMTRHMFTLAKKNPAASRSI